MYMDEIEPNVFLAIGHDLTVNNTHVSNIHNLEQFPQKYMEKIENEIQTHITNISEIKNNIADLDEKQKQIYTSHQFKYFFPNKNTIESQKYYYNSITIDKLKEEQKILENKLTKLKLIHKYIYNKYTNYNLLRCAK